MSIKDRLLKLINRLNKASIPYIDKSIKTSPEEALRQELGKISEKEMREYCRYFTESTVTPAAEMLSNYIQSKYLSSIDLNDKVDDFIQWYTENLADEEHTDPIKLRNFIEKMAVWYELRYPDYEINRLMPAINQEQTKVSDVMFNKNKYINQRLDQESEIRVLDWDEFYNAKVFINSLSFEEQKYFRRPKYNNLKNEKNVYIKLTSNGVIKRAKGLGTGIWLSEEEIANIDKMFVGKHIKDYLSFLQEREHGNGYNCLKKIIERYDNQVYQKEEMLNCVMYRIIERGGNRIGPRRAFLFAKEFKRNIDIPMAYGVDYSDSGLRLFVNEYIKAGGSEDLVCYVEYFSRASKKEEIETVSIREILDCDDSYTKEEIIRLRLQKKFRKK